MIEFFDGLKKKGVEWFIKSRLSRLAKTETEKEFYKLFDEILARLYLLGKDHEHTRGALENMRKAFQERHPITQIARLLLQERLSKKTREQLARNFFVDWVASAKKRDRLEEEGFKAPWFFVISPTYTCNLNCYGCYAHEYKKGQGMSFETFDRIIKEAKELGIRFLTISGGEPFFWRDETAGTDFIDLAKLHNDVFFQVYTNGTLLDERTIERLAGAGNIAPAISQEGMKKETDERRKKGTWEKIGRARKMLYEAKVLQGFSITVTRQNAGVVSSDEFIDNLIEQEISFGWYFNYIPIGKKPAVELMPTPEQRDYLRRKVWGWRSTKLIFSGDFWNDGCWVGGCIAGGRRYFHINAFGDIEPCVFIHFAVDNIHRLWKEGKGLREAITSKFFLDFRKEQLRIDNLLTPCLIIDNPECLRNVVRGNNAYPTHPGAETIINEPIASSLDEYSSRLRNLTWPEFKKMMAGEYDTRVVKLSEVIQNHLERNKKQLEPLLAK